MRRQRDLFDSIAENKSTKLFAFYLRDIAAIKRGSLCRKRVAVCAVNGAHLDVFALSTCNIFPLVMTHFRPPHTIIANFNTSQR